MGYYRMLSAASTQRFMASPFVKYTLDRLPNGDFQEEDRVIPVRNGQINIRIYRPQSTLSHGRPVMVMSHGGGWCLGGLDTEVFLCQLLCRSLDLIVVDVEYRLCPEFQYPSPVLDVFDAVKWVRCSCYSCISLTDRRLLPTQPASMATWPKASCCAASPAEGILLQEQLILPETKSSNRP